MPFPITNELWESLHSLVGQSPKTRRNKSCLPEIAKQTAEIMLHSISICTNNRPELSTVNDEQLAMFKVIAHVLRNKFDGDVRKTIEWYQNATLEDIGRIRVLISLGDDVDYFS